ncbi:hypothetical protein CAEBREN_22747 [Caenorhabditis brenneri]|uniref:Uncharacterized protein n=1 Tax=Caenorhabditis brenneri TaxID=135651 RepID=G0NXE0_CAEBE|nr:hypothetical protein CAEBREN_22747 [Caenorhabditis brenneri]
MGSYLANGSTSSPESAANLRLGDAERTPGGFISTETSPPSTEGTKMPAIGAQQPQASVPPFRQNQEPPRHFYKDYEQPISNGLGRGGVLTTLSDGSLLRSIPMTRNWNRMSQTGSQP